MDQAHSLEGVKWDQGANKVTDKGLQTVKNEAYAFKARYVGSLLPKKYEPLSIYLRAQYESVPISDAYAFMMSLYPDTADGLDLMKGYQAIDTSNLPITSQELNGLRARLGLGLPSTEKQNVDLYPGNPDLLFVHAVSKNFPEWDTTIKQMRKSALDEFQGQYPNFINDLKRSLKKENDDALTLGNALFYLDYYNMAISNGQTPTRASITGDVERQEKAYYRAFFDKGFLGKNSYNRVLANAYLKHIVEMINLKKQDLTENNLSDKRIHEMKASLDFGSKLTWLTIIKVLGGSVDDWGYSFGDTINWELLRDGKSFSVKTTINETPFDLTSESKGGILALDKWNDYLISRMYYGSITDLQKDSGAENPDNHIIRDTSDSETAWQWWQNQKKYEDRVFLKQTLDTTALPLQSIDKSGNSAPTTIQSSTVTTRQNRPPSSSEVTFGSTSESETATAIATDLSIGNNDEISFDKSFQFNTLDKIGTFERTSGQSISLAHGEQMSLGLDNVATKDIQHSLYKPIKIPTSNENDIVFSNAHQIRMDGSESIQTAPNGKALQLNHYIPIEVDRLKATVTQDNAISLLGANEIPDNHVYSSKIRQNTLRPVTVLSGEHYKVDLTSVDPENAAVKRTSTGDDSVHVEGMSKTKVPLPAEEPVGSGFIKINSGSDNVQGSTGARTGQTPATYPSTAASSVNVGSGTSYVGSRLSTPTTRPGFLTLGGK